MLPWWKRLGEAFGTSSLNKRVHLQSYGLGAWLFFLAGLGGEGEEENNLVLVGSRRWRGNPSAAAESSTMVVRCRPSIHADGRQLSTPSMRRLFNLLVRPLSYGSTTAFLFASIPCSPATEAMAGGRFHRSSVLETTKDLIAFSDVFLRSYVLSFRTMLYFSILLRSCL